MILAEIGLGEVVIGVVGSLSVAIPATIGAYATYRKVTNELTNNGGSSFKDKIDERFDTIESRMDTVKTLAAEQRTEMDKTKRMMATHEERYSELEAYVHARFHQIINQLTVLIGSMDVQNKLNEFRRMNQYRTRADDAGGPSAETD